MSQMVAKAMEPMRQVTEAFNHSGIFDAMAIVGKAVKQHADYMKDWSDALSLPVVSTTQAVILRRIETSPRVAEISQEAKMEIANMVIEGLRKEILSITPQEGSKIDLWVDGNIVYRKRAGIDEPLRYKLSQQRKKLLLSLSHRPQNREVLRVQTGSQDRDTFYKLVQGLNEQLEQKLVLAQRVIIHEDGYRLHQFYSVRRIDP